MDIVATLGHTYVPHVLGTRWTQRLPVPAGTTTNQWSNPVPPGFSLHVQFT